MAETKKRWRPSLTAYRELESQVKELEQYKKGEVVPLKDFKELESKNITLEKSNKWLQERMDSAGDECKRLREKLSEKEAEITRLENRSLIERILNR